MVAVNLTEWARENGVNRVTAYRWFARGTLPVPATRINSRSILVQVPEAGSSNRVALYARVSSSDQRNDLDAQMTRLEAYAAAEGLEVVARACEVGSGMNGHRPKLKRLLCDPAATAIVVEHRERLGRMNTELIEAALVAQGRRIVVVDDAELEDDLVADMTEVLTSFCARLYGARGAKNRAARALARAKEPAA